MPSGKLITNFDAVAKMDIGPLAQNCLTNTVGNPRYPDAKALTDAMQAALAPYSAAASVLHPTPTQTAELAQLRIVLNQSVSAVATMANGPFTADEAALLSTGLSLGKLPERRTTPEAPPSSSSSTAPSPAPSVPKPSARPTPWPSSTSTPPIASCPTPSG